MRLLKGGDCREGEDSSLGGEEVDGFADGVDGGFAGVGCGFGIEFRLRRREGGMSELWK